MEDFDELDDDESRFSFLDPLQDQRQTTETFTSGKPPTNSFQAIPAEEMSPATPAGRKAGAPQVVPLDQEDAAHNDEGPLEGNFFTYENGEEGEEFVNPMHARAAEPVEAPSPLHNKSHLTDDLQPPKSPMTSAAPSPRASERKSRRQSAKETKERRMAEKREKKEAARRAKAEKAERRKSLKAERKSKAKEKSTKHLKVTTTSNMDTPRASREPSTDGFASAPATPLSPNTPASTGSAAQAALVAKHALGGSNVVEGQAMSEAERLKMAEKKANRASKKLEVQSLQASLASAAKSARTGQPEEPLAKRETSTTDEALAHYDTSEPATPMTPAAPAADAPAATTKSPRSKIAAKPAAIAENEAYADDMDTPLIDIAATAIDVDDVYGTRGTRFGFVNPLHFEAKSEPKLTKKQLAAKQKADKKLAKEQKRMEKKLGRKKKHDEMIEQKAEKVRSMKLSRSSKKLDAAADQAAKAKARAEAEAKARAEAEAEAERKSADAERAAAEAKAKEAQSGKSASKFDGTYGQAALAAQAVAGRIQSMKIERGEDTGERGTIEITPEERARIKAAADKRKSKKMDEEKQRKAQAAMLAGALKK